MIRNHHSRKNTCLHLFLQRLTLTTYRMSFVITSPKKSAPSETTFLHQIQMLALIPLSLKTLAKFWACHWWNCLKHHQQCTCQVLWTRSHFHHTPLWKPWHPLANHHEHHQHISYHCQCTTWSEDSHRQTSRKSHHMTKLFWKTTALFLTFHFCPKSSKKTTSATTFSQPIEQDTG